MALGVVQVDSEAEALDIIRGWERALLDTVDEFAASLETVEVHYLVRTPIPTTGPWASKQAASHVRMPCRAEVISVPALRLDCEVNV